MNGELPWTRGQSLGNVSKPFVKKILNTGGGGNEVAKQRCQTSKTFYFHEMTGNF